MGSIVQAFVLAATFAAPQGAPPPKEWNQPHGNAASTAYVDVVPLKAPPTERWRIAKGQLLAAPVVSQAKLFVVLREEGKTRLLVLDPATGATVAKADLEGIGEVFALAVADGLAAIVEPAAVHGWRLAGSELRREKSIPGSFGGEPTLSGTTLLVPRATGGGVQAIDWANGKAVLVVPKSFGRASVSMDDKFGDKPGASLVAVATDADGSKLTLHRFPVVAGTAAFKLGPAEALFGGVLAAKADDAPQTVLVAVKAKENVEWCGWLGGERGSGMLRKSGLKLLEFRSPPAAKSGRLYGFDHAERLVEFDAATDNVNPLVEKENLRKGAQLGAPSIARDVLFLGNWAVELGSRRVLWCLETITADGPAIPAGDDLLVIRTQDGQLVGFGNGGAAAKEGESATKATAAADASPPKVLPGSTPGIVRSDGLFVAGKATALENGRWRIEPEGGKPQELDADAVALVDDGKSARRIGEEVALYRAFWNVLAARHAEALVALLGPWQEAKLFDDSRRLIEEAQRHGLATARVDELLGAIAGKPSAKVSNTNPAKKKCAQAEAEARSDSADAIVRAAKWCASHDAKTAATVLWLRASEVAPKEPPDPELLLDWKPKNFPSGATPEAESKAWLVWAAALLPSGAVFADLDESALRRISVTKFKDALALRTKNILLFTKETDPALLGPLLARGEATVRALQKILGPSPTGMRSSAPLEVRLHQTRSEYLADRIVGSLPMTWSAGCFSPTDGVSRFYSRQEGDEDDPLGHTLHEVFAHELTHHYVDRRWMRDSAGDSAGGYWMVEGFAEFVAEQALEMGRLGEKFDDATVRSLDATAATAALDMLIQLDSLFEFDAKLFHKELEGGRFGPIQLKHTLKQISLDKRGVFYAESAAFTFFVMNRCGEKGRAAYVAWLQNVYSGKPFTEPWKDLGFADLTALKKAFREFLAGI